MRGAMRPALLLAAAMGVASAALTATREAYPQIIAHRGACNYVPEHSLAAYRLAMDLGTDYIEPDLVLTSDGVFVAMHDLLLDQTTDVADHPEFADKKTTKVVSGVSWTGFFASDFTLAEIRTLRLRQRLSDTRTKLYDDLLQIPTFEEIAGLVHTWYANTSRLVGMYPELKHPSYHHDLGFDMEDMLLSSLRTLGFLTTNAPNDLSHVVPVVVQCFNASALRYLRPLTDLPLVMLLAGDVEVAMSEEALDDYATFANALGPPVEFFTNQTGGNLTAARQLVHAAHSRSLSLHPWQIRLEPRYVDPPFHGDARLWTSYLYCCVGLDGLFTEAPDLNREVVDGMTGNWSEQCYTACPQVLAAGEEDDDGRHRHHGGGSSTTKMFLAALAAAALVIAGLCVASNELQRRRTIELRELPEDDIMSTVTDEDAARVPLARSGT